MPWLPLYLLDSDIELLNDFLNRDEEVYFIEQVDQQKWKLTKKMNLNVAGYFNKYRLWHLPSGPVPLIEKKINEGVSVASIFNKNEYVHVQDPFEPWPGTPCSNLPGLPFFGDDESKVFDLTIHNPINQNERILISDFQWEGNRYSLIGKGAEKVTEKWWKRLRGFVRRNSLQIPRSNDSSLKKEIYAFPKALTDIKNGRICSRN